MEDVILRYKWLFCGSKKQDSIAKMDENGDLAERLVQSQTAPSSPGIELSSGGIRTADSYKCCSLGCSSASDTVMHNSA